MKTVTEWFREQQGWKHENCPECHGYGVVSDYHNEDFHGAKDCPKCNGAARYWITPNGRYVAYPGGPFC